MIATNISEKEAEKIVDKLIDDLQGRSGLGNVWDEMDDEIRRDLKDAWIEIVMKT
jgi:hypothetical protein